MTGTDSGFGLENLPWCRFNGGRIGVRLEDEVIDIEAAGLPFDRRVWRERIEDAPQRARRHVDAIHYEMPFVVPDYTDFYASIHHASNVGKLFRPDNPLLPNYRWVPLAYHGRASTLVATDTPIRRPEGQLGENQFGPTEQLDYELELGIFIDHSLKGPIPVTMAPLNIAGFCLVNDWSARDIQRWEYQPLGPFLGKSFATSVSPWVISPEALEPFRVPADERAETTLPYLRPAGWHYDITLEAYVNGKLTCRSNARDLYWTFAQMIAHHTSNGCILRSGDLLASGTVSGPDSHGCLLETGGPYLQDGDEVVLTGYASRPGLPKISFGQCRGKILPCSPAVPSSKAQPPQH